MNRLPGRRLAPVVSWLMVAALPIGAVSATDAPAVETSISGFAFEADILVEAATSIRWHNTDVAPHTVTAADGSFDSGPIAPGASYQSSFPSPGSISYACAIHPSMSGTVTVRAADTSVQSPPGDATSAALGPTVVLHRATIFDTDPLGIGGPAMSILVPDGWTAEGGPVWRHQYANLATLEGRVVSPDRLFGVEFFPLFPQVWQDGGIPFFPPGSIYLGNEVRPPIRDAGAFLENLILPSYRAAFGARIVAREPLPEVADAYARDSLPGTEVVAERVLTEHVVEGERMLEEFTVVLTFTPNPGLPGALLWAPQQLFSIRAPADRFDALRPVLQTIATSPVVDLDWYAGYQFVLDLSLRNGLEAIRAAGAASRIIAETNAQISDIIIQGYEERQATHDAIFDAVSQTIRGVETYLDPFDGGTLELPNGYAYAYASAEGSVILTNEPGFDPVRQLPGQTWETLTLER